MSIEQHDQAPAAPAPPKTPLALVKPHVPSAPPVDMSEPIRPEWMRDRNRLADLHKHLESEGWRMTEDGPECYDQGSAMAAEVCAFVIKLLDAEVANGP